MTAPLFGKDSIPQLTSRFFGIIGTVVLWLILILCMIFIPVNSGKKDFKTVQIVLSSTPVVDKEKTFEDSQSSSPRIDEDNATNIEKVAETPGEQTAEAIPEVLPEPIEETVNQPAEVQEIVAESVIEEKTAPVVPEVVEKAPPAPKKVEEAPKPVEKPAPKVEMTPSKPVEQPVKPAEPDYVPVETVLYKSNEELMAEQMQSQKQKPQNVDWDALFGDSEASAEESTDVTTSKKVVGTQSDFSGVAGESSGKTTNQRVESTSTQNRNNTGTSTSSTSSNLSKIKNATSYSSASGGSFGTVKAKTISSGTGTTSMEMSDGSVRALLVPEVPNIELPEELGALIDTEKTVNISFKVLAGGNIGEISITPEAILPKAVRDEIRSQLMSWRFEAASSTATATFEYTIKKQ